MASSPPGEAVKDDHYDGPRKAVLADVHDEWQAAERRYFSEGSMAKLSQPADQALSIGELQPTG